MRARCPHCGGMVESTRRCDIDATMLTHQQHCPGIARKKEQPT